MSGVQMVDLLSYQAKAGRASGEYMMINIGDMEDTILARELILQSSPIFP